MSDESFDQVQRIFLEALDIPDEHRDAWLIEKCKGDQELLRELQTLLACDSPEVDPLENPIEALIDIDRTSQEQTVRTTPDFGPSSSPPTGQQFLDKLVELRLISDDQRAAIEQQHLDGLSPQAIKQLATDLVDQEKLTQYQASALLKGTPNLLVDKYVLEDLIDTGGMGAVFKAKQMAPIKRKVALKVIRPGLDSQQVIGRFRAERQALSMMNHPNIAKAFDAGQTSAGRPYFVMELVNGIPITQYCDEQRLSIRERLQLFEPVCRAVQHAHQKGIIHRDLKPSNILVAQYDGKPVPKVIDFGVAKATNQKLTENTISTQFGQILGTLEYMSPEQSQFNDLDVDTRADVYSLGVVLYELLTGQTPFDRNRMRKAALDEILKIIRHEDPPRPSLRLTSSDSDTSSEIASNRHVELRRLSTLIQGELDWIVMRAMEKDRTRRYETVNGLATDIRRYLANEPVSACPPSVTYQLRKFARRHAAVFNTVAAIGLAMILGLVATAWQAYRAGQQRDRALIAERNADYERASAEASKDEALAAKDEAEAASDEANAALFEMNTSYGLMAAEQGKPAEAMLWFANAATIAKPGSPEEEESRIRLRSWSHIVSTPVRTMLHEGERITSWGFDFSGEFLVTLTPSGRCRIWNIDTMVDAIELPMKVSAFVCSPTQPEIAVGFDNGNVSLLSWPDFKMMENPQIAFEEPISALEYGPGGETLAIAGRKVKIWSLETKEFTLHDYRHPASVTSLQFSDDGDLLLSACRDDYARVFDLQQLGIRDPISGRRSNLSTAFAHHDPGRPAFINGGTEFMTNVGSWYETQTGKFIKSIGSATARSVLPDPTGNRILHSTFTGDLAIWNAHSRKRTSLRSRVSAVAISPDGSEMAVAMSRGSIQRIDLETNRSIGADLPTTMGYHHKLTYSPDGQRLFIADLEGSVVQWLLAGQKRTIPSFAAGDERTRIIDRRCRIASIDGRGSDLLRSDSGDFILPTGANWMWGRLSTTRVLDAVSLKPVGDYLVADSLILDACFSPDEKEVIAATSSNQLLSWNWRTGEPSRQTVHLPTEPLCLQFSADKTLLHVLCIDGCIHAVDFATGEVCFSMRHGGVRRNDFLHDKFSPLYERSNGFPAGLFDFHLDRSANGKWLVTSGIDSEIGVWDSLTGERRYPPLRFPTKASQAIVSHDDSILAVSHGNNISFFDFENGSQIAPTIQHRDTVASLSLSEDGNLISAALDIGESYVWDWKNSKMVCKPIRQRGTGLLLGSPARYLLIANEQSASIWSVLTGRQLSPPYALSSEPRTILLTGDRKAALVTGQGDFRDRSYGAHIDILPLDVLDPESSVSNEELQRYGEVLARRYVDAGAVLSLPKTDWEDRFREMRQLHPTLFPAKWKTEEESEWHRQQMKRSDRAREEHTAKWHLDRLAKLDDSPGFQIETRKVFDRALQMARRGNAQEAFAIWKAAKSQSVVKEDRQCIEISMSLGIQLLLLDELELSLRVFDQSMHRWYPVSKSEFRVLAANVWQLAKRDDIETQHYEIVETLARKITNISPEVAAYWTTLGIAHFRNKHWNEALAALKKSIKLKSGKADVYDACFLAMTHSKLGHSDLAKSWLGIGIERANSAESNDGPETNLLEQAASVLGTSIDAEENQKSPATKPMEKMNLVACPSFENRMANQGLPSGWYGLYSTPPNAYQVNLVSDAETKQQCLEIAGTGDWGFVVSPYLPISEGMEYRIQANIRLTGKPDVRADVRMAYFDEFHKFLGNRHSFVDPTNRQWQTVSAIGGHSLFPDAKYITTELWLTGNGVAWFDDVSMILEGEDPHWKSTYSRLNELEDDANTFRKNREWDRANQMYREIVQFAPYKIAAWMQMVDVSWWIASSNGDSFDDALSVYPEARIMLGLDSPELNIDSCHAAWCLLTGHQEEYEKVCRVVFERHGDTDRPRTMWQVARILSLGDQKVVPTQQVVQMARKAVKTDPSKGYFRTGVFKGLIRSGLYEEALTHCERIDQRALCHAYLGNVEQAQDFLDLAQKEIDENGSDPSSLWPHLLRLTWQLNLREAKKVLSSDE